jgi:hypothetical protein
MSQVEKQIHSRWLRTIIFRHDPVTNHCSFLPLGGSGWDFRALGLVSTHVASNQTAKVAIEELTNYYNSLQPPEEEFPPYRGFIDRLEPVEL